mmetsp:Transcript_38386/g.109720  ORF Transcript_38386/g.109720 Transcript_38386/m.109720 type:complete len:212 (+) Transcript_38386:30-665(+)
MKAQHTHESSQSTHASVRSADPIASQHVRMGTCTDVKHHPSHTRAMPTHRCVLPSPHPTALGTRGRPGGRCAAGTVTFRLIDAQPALLAFLRGSAMNTTTRHSAADECGVAGRGWRLWGLGGGGRRHDATMLSTVLPLLLLHPLPLLSTHGRGRLQPHLSHQCTDAQHTAGTTTAPPPLPNTRTLRAPLSTVADSRQGAAREAAISADSEV